MEYEILAWPPGPQLVLDHERFSYAGKFVMTNTGKAVARAEDTIVAALAFDEDHTDSTTLKLRYVTVAREYRGNEIAPTLITGVRERALERGYERLHIAVNNPYAYQALYRAGFAYTGSNRGIAELLLAYPHERTRTQYHDGLREFRDRDISAAEHEFCDTHLEQDPPHPVSVPDVIDGTD